MHRLLQLGVAVVASLVLYVAVFSVVHRPLTLGEISTQLQFKQAYAASLPGPRLLIFAGSNGRYSHRCDAIAEALTMPCANLSIAVGVGLDFLLDELEQASRRGDWVYMPLEYSQYAVTRDVMNAGSKNAVLVHDMPAQLWRQEAARIARAYASFDLPFLIHGLAEMALQRAGVQRRTSLATLTPQGDEQGHSALRGQAYAEFVRSARFEPVVVPADSHALNVLSAYLRRARAQGVRVVGGLPTMPDNVALSEAQVDAIRQVFEREGQWFVSLPGRSRYSLSCFFDTLYHLNEECQLAHSKALGQALLDARETLATSP